MPAPFSRYQDLTFETASLEQLERVLAVALELTGLRYLFRTGGDARGTFHPSAAAAYSMRFTERLYGRYQPPDQRSFHYQELCQIRSDDRAYGLSTLIPTESPRALLEQTMTLARGADRAAFEARTGEGPFAGSDGVTGIGWRIHGGAMLNTDLVVSLCHIYYPK